MKLRSNEQQIINQKTTTTAAATSNLTRASGVEWSDYESIVHQMYPWICHRSNKVHLNNFYEFFVYAKMPHEQYFLSFLDWHLTHRTHKANACTGDEIVNRNRQQGVANVSGKVLCSSSESKTFSWWMDEQERERDTERKKKRTVTLERKAKKTSSRDEPCCV